MSRRLTGARIAAATIDGLAVETNTL